MEALLPANFSCQNHILAHPYDDYGFVKFSTDKANYILGLIESIPARNKDSQEKRLVNGGFTLICSKYVQSYIHDYKDYIKYFEDTGVIESDNKYVSANFQYSNKAKCYGYKFTELYSSGEFYTQSYSTEFNKLLIKKLNVLNSVNSKELKHLTKWLWPVSKLEIDYETAKFYLQLKKDAQILDPSLRDKWVDGATGHIIMKDPKVQYTHSLYSACSIAQGEIYCKVDETVSRLHTNLTNIKSELRNLIKCNGEHLYSIDIRCSQPYLTLALFNPKISSILKENERLIRSLPIIKNFWKEVNNNDFEMFKNLVTGNNTEGLDLYTYIQSEAKKDGILYSDRNEVKRGVFEVLFSKNVYSTKSKSAFKKTFPTVDKLYRKIKDKDNSDLACLLQSIESQAVTRIITSLVHKKYPKAPLFTIHDSIATTEEYKDFVGDTMTRELRKITMYSPSLKVEKWEPNALNWKMYKV